MYRRKAAASSEFPQHRTIRPPETSLFGLAEANCPAVTPCSSEELGYTKAGKLLQPLDEERATDAALTKLAKSVINLDAEKDQAA